MKHQALFSSKDKSKKDQSVMCCNFCLALCKQLINGILFAFLDDLPANWG